jgi:hypothetical protein
MAFLGQVRGRVPGLDAASEKATKRAMSGRANLDSLAARVMRRE